MFTAFWGNSRAARAIVVALANGTGQFEFRLDRLHGNNHVPDAGSTLGLLAFALGGLSLHRIRRLL